MVESFSLNLVSNALVQVEALIVKSDETIEQLQTHLQKLSTQKIGLGAQKLMLTELKKKIEEEIQTPTIKPNTANE